MITLSQAYKLCDCDGDFVDMEFDVIGVTHDELLKIVWKN